MDNSVSLDFESTLLEAARSLPKDVDPAKNKHIILGLLFLKNANDWFSLTRASLPPGVNNETRSEYESRRCMWVPRAARWDRVEGMSQDPLIGEVVDSAMRAIMRDTRALEGALPVDFTNGAISPSSLGQIVRVVGKVQFGSLESATKDSLGRSYEYLLSKFDLSDAQETGQFYTPPCLVDLLVRMLDPTDGTVFDPCCGSGGMFLQSKEFLSRHGWAGGGVTVYGQEINPVSWMLARMNMALRGVSANIGDRPADTIRDDVHPGLLVDYVCSNPPFNMKNWGYEELVQDPRWVYGVPPPGNANFAWIQHILSHLAPTGVAGFILSNGSMFAENRQAEVDIRGSLVDHGIVDCMVAFPSRLFYSTAIPTCMWVISHSDSSHGKRHGEVLFIDARARLTKERGGGVLIAKDVAEISDTYRAWRGRSASYADRPGFCRSVKNQEIQDNGYDLTPGRYIDPIPVLGDVSDDVASAARELLECLKEGEESSRDVCRAMAAIGMINDQ